MQTKVQVALLSLFIFAERCIGFPTEHTIGNTKITTIVPDDFVDVTEYRQLQKKVHEDNPKLPKIINIFVSKSDALKIASQNPNINVSKQIRVCVSNKYRDRSMTQAEFDDFKSILKTKYTSNRFDSVVKKVNDKKSYTLSKELEQNYTFKTLSTLNLGVDYEDKDKIIWTIVHKDKISTPQGDEQINIITTGAILLVKGKLLNIYYESVLNSDEDLFWCQTNALDYAKKMHLANAEEKNVKTDFAMKFAKFEKGDIAFIYPTVYTFKEIFDKGDQILLLESADSNSVLFEITPKVLDLESECLNTFARIKEMYKTNGSVSVTDVTEKTTVDIAGLNWRVSQFTSLFNQTPLQCDLYVTQNNWKTLTVLCQYSIKDKKTALDRFSQITKSMTINKNAVEADLNRYTLLARDIYVTIAVANSERSKYGLKNVWPTSDRTAYGVGDISEQSFVSSSSFFNCLLDMPHYATSKWNPYVSKKTMPAISASFSSASVEKNIFSKTNNMWIVVANMEEGDSDNLPVLISRNIAVAELENLINKGMTQDDLKKVIQLGNIYKTPFGDQGAIVVLKGGGTKVILPGKSTVLDFVRDPVELDQSKPRKPIKYLLP
jgi:hypothetical protein